MLRPPRLLLFNRTLRHLWQRERRKDGNRFHEAVVVIGGAVFLEASIQVAARSLPWSWIYAIRLIGWLLYPVAAFVWWCYHREQLLREFVWKYTDAHEGRLPTCLNCGYDLRATEREHCPECGTSVHPVADDLRQ